MNTLCSWSGGKDSCFALMKEIENGSHPTVLLNMMNENGRVSRSHGLPLSILNQQAKALNLPLKTVPSTWADYENNYINALKGLKETYDLQTAVFGDIDIQSNREWEEKVCDAAAIEALIPLWQRDRRELVIEMINIDIKAIIVSCNTHLGEDFLGKQIDFQLIDELEEKGVDVCGENGEYHTAVIDCPIFSTPVKLPSFSKKTYSDYCFIDWKVN